MSKVIINPVTRTVGPLSLELEIEGNKVKDAKISVQGVRAFELILEGKTISDLPFISERICAKCSTSHAIVSSILMERLNNLFISKNGRVLRNILQALSFIESHIGSFYHVMLPDYLDFISLYQYTGKERKLVDLRNKLFEMQKDGDISPFSLEASTERITDSETVLRLISNYLDAFTIRSKIQRIASVIAGKMPHAASIHSGGITATAGASEIKELIFQFRDVSKWIKSAFMPDALEVIPSLLSLAKVGLGHGNFLSAGGIVMDELGEQQFFSRGAILEKDIETVLHFEPENIIEETSFSWYSQDSDKRTISSGTTKFDLNKKAAYSFSKAPRYKEKSMEVGPLARLLVKGDETLLKLLKDLNIGPSLLTRISSYAIETKLLTELVFDLLAQIKPDEKTFVIKKSPDFGDSMAFTESPAGSLIYFANVENSKISSLQIITGSTWNLSPKGDKLRGQAEEALIELEISNLKNPIEALRIVRSFSPCPVCASH